jgi:uncharacterized protein (TIGR03067 family)
MKALGLASVSIVFFAALAVQGGEEAAVKKERAALQGVWKITEFETAAGKKDDLVGATLEFDKDGKSMVFTKDADAKKGTFKLNPAGKPKEIDLSPQGEDKVLEAIYQVEKTTLKICVAANPGDGRPSEFATKDGKSYVLITLEKAK